MGWQEHYDPRPSTWQWLKAITICRVIGHWWKKRVGECRVCGKSAEQLN